MRPIVEGMITQLLAQGKREISLDEVGDTIGAEAVSQAEIELILQRLEDAGCAVGSLTPNLREHLHRVLRAGRALRAPDGAVPSVASVAEATGLPAGAVRAALLYGQVLSR